MPTIQADHLEKGIIAIFKACGVPAAEAQIVAAHLVDAEACGLISHGVLRVPQYVKNLADGYIVPGAKLRVLRELSATAVLDGQHGFGQVMATAAMDWAIERAEQAGIGAATLYNCSHTGRIGSYTEQAARRGLAAMMMVNSGGNGQLVAPFGGVAGRLSTNPISIAVPTDADAPLLLDMASSIVPEGKIRAMMTEGKRIPEGWVIDSQGRPTTNPADLYGPPHGALLPFGGHKGFGLSMMIDAIVGGLSGAGCCVDPTVPLAGKTDGVFVLAIKIAAFQPLLDFQRNIGRQVQHVKSSPPAAGVKEVLVPGEVEARNRRQRLRDGIPVEAATWKLVTQILEKHQLSIEVS